MSTYTGLCSTARTKDYGISRIGGIGFSDAPYRVQLADFGFHRRERFLYEYDFGDGWQHDLRVEAIYAVVPSDPPRQYPVCVGGRRAAPPEDCGGPWAFLDLRQRHSVVAVTRRLAEIFGEVLGTTHLRCQRAIIDEHRDELKDLLRWAHLDRFERRQVNARFGRTRCGTPATRRVVP